MKKWNVITLLVLIVTAMASQASAQECGNGQWNQGCYQSCEPACCWEWSPCCTEKIAFECDFLWWKPCINDMDFAYRFDEDDGRNDVEFKRICPDWDYGLRGMVYLPCFWCDLSLALSWTYFDTKDKDHLHVDDDDNGDISSTLLHPGLIAAYIGDFGGRFRTANGDWELRYNEWDILFAYNLSCNSCHEFSPYFGVAGLWLDQKVRVHLYNPTGVNDDHEARVKWKSDFWGVGLRAGSYYELQCNKCFTIYAKADGTLLAGEADNENQQRAIDGSASLVVRTRLNIDDDECCHFIPGWHIGAGIIYDTCLCDFGFSVRVGYEFVQWYNIPNPRVFTGEDLNITSGHSTSASTRTLGFHGLVAGLGVTF